MIKPFTVTGWYCGRAAALAIHDSSSWASHAQSKEVKSNWAQSFGASCRCSSPTSGTLTYPHALATWPPNPSLVTPMQTQEVSSQTPSVPQHSPRGKPFSGLSFQSSTGERCECIDAAETTKDPYSTSRFWKVQWHRMKKNSTGLK